MPWDPIADAEKTFPKKERIVANAEAVGALKIPDASRRFLTAVGFPRECAYFLRFDLLFEPMDASVLDGLQNRPPFLSSISDLRSIAVDYDYPVCICCDGSGWIVHLQSDINRVRFINSSPELFGGFLARHARYVSGEDPTFLDSFEPIARQADPLVFDDSEGYWSIIFEQIRDELL
jgi:hypothetical protein